MDSINAHEDEAARYDEQVREYDVHGPEVVFGMMFEYVKRGDTLLDLGIGTGLGSALFASIGLEVSGLDGSAEMLKVCEAKGFTKELKRFDLRKTPLPYADREFDHVICCDVLHFFGALEPIVRDVSRVIKPGGIFAFTVATQSRAQLENESNPTDFLEVPTRWGVSIYAHSDPYLDRLLTDGGFEKLKTQKLLMFEGEEDGTAELFKVCVGRRVKP